MSPLSPPDLSTFLHTSLGVLNSSQLYVGVELARDVYLATPSYEYGSLDALPMTTSLLAIYAALKDATDLSPGSTKERAQKTVLKILERGVSLDDINRFPLSIASPLLEAIRTVQNSPPPDWPLDAYVLIGRNDLAKMALGGSEELPPVGDGYLQKLPNTVSLGSYPFMYFMVISHHSACTHHTKLST
jgi:anaphase-promoting complex subunit 1